MTFSLPGFRKQAGSWSLMLALLVPITLLPVISFGKVPPDKSKAPDKQPAAAQPSPRIISLPGVQSLPDTDGSGLTPFERYAERDLSQPTAPLLSGDLTGGFYSMLDRDVLPSSMKSYVAMADECPTGFHTLGGSFMSDPTAAAFKGKIIVFARGVNSELFYRVLEKGAPAEWQSLGGKLISNPASFFNATTLYVEATGSDGERYYRSTTDGATFTEWTKGTVHALTTNSTASSHGITFKFRQGNGMNPAMCLQRTRNTKQNSKLGTMRSAGQTSAKSGAETNSMGPITNSPACNEYDCTPWCAEYPYCGGDPPPSGDQYSPNGVMDAADADSIRGWSFDPDNPSVSNDVHIYIDGPAGSGTGFAVTANQSRPDVDQYFGITGDHGYSMPIPSQYADGQQHVVYAYGIDTGANSPSQLGNTPMYFTKNPPPPDTPSWGAIYSISQTQLDVYWNTVPGATSYHLGMDGNIIAYNFPGSGYAVTGLAPGSTHTFNVQAVNQWGVSNWSAPLSQTTQPPLMPATPTWGVVNTISQSQLDLHWNASANSTGYNVRMDGNIILNNFGGHDYAVQGLAPASTHTFEIQGVNQYGVSAWSDSRTGTTLAPPTPTPTPTPPPPTPTPTPTPPGTINTSRARLSPKNSTGGTNLYSRNFGWGNSLAGLSGRGLDVGVGISYNSLVWVKNGSNMVFNPNKDNVTPGFRFGYPVIEPAYVDSLTGKNTFLVVLPSGARTEFRQDGTSNNYDAVDSSYTQLQVINATTLRIVTTDGTQSVYELKNGAYRCSQIIDRNGNLITVNHDANGLLQSVMDTLGRVISVSYDAGGQPSQITQTWANGTHTYATFTYTTMTINTNFSGMSLVGIANNASVKVLQKITYTNGSATQFDYNSYGQVWKVSNYAADNHLLNYSATDLNTIISQAQTDCPRYTEFHNWTENFNVNASNQAQEVVIPVVYQENQTFTLPDNTQATGTLLQLTAPDGTISKTYVGASSWMEALPITTEDWANENSTYNRKRWTWTAYTQDNTSLSYILNPRTIESKIGDNSNIKRTTIEYHTQSGNPAAALYGLIKNVVQYDANGTSQLKRSHTEYNFDANYLARRIIGLPAESTLFDENNSLMSRVTYNYDEGNFAGTNQNISPIQHDSTNYGVSFIGGRANLTSTTRWDVTNPTNNGMAVTSQIKYDTAGNVVAQIDPLNRMVAISYADSYDDNQNRNTYAYPTTLTDPAGFSSTVKYRYDFGANVYTTSPAPAGNSIGKITSSIYDSIGRLQKETVVNTGAYTRYEYPANGFQSLIYSTITDINNNGVDSADEVLTETYTDGAGRPYNSRTELPGSAGGWSATLTRYDIMGRVKSQSVPTEVNAGWAVSGDDAARGYLWTTNEYDWKGRTTRVINTDGTDKLMSYDGCGCAGGQVTTISGEQVPEGRRRQKVYDDILGRSYKTETLNWDGSVYSTTKTTFNGRDQATLVRQYAGTDTSNSYQDTIMDYDGHGRLKHEHRPVQDANTATTYNYNADDSTQSVVDARGASTNYTYNSRWLVEQIAYGVLNGSNIQVASTVNIAYDNTGNRTQMTDGVGNVSYEYNQLSQLTAETRQFNDSLPNAPTAGNKFKLEYNYSLSGQLKSYKDPYNRQFDFGYDRTGKNTSITGTAYAGVTSYLSNEQYRAFGAVKQVSYGNDTTATMTYNNRLQPTNFRLNDATQTLFGKDYYYTTGANNDNDGLLKRSVHYDATMTSADQSKRNQVNTYNAQGRVATSYTGEPSLTPFSADVRNGHFQQTFSYDAFGNLINKNDRDFGTYVIGCYGCPRIIYYGETIVNNRTTSSSVSMSNSSAGGTITNYQYDAEGHLVGRDGVAQNFDAAGRMYFRDDTSSYPDNYYAFDGDSNKSKWVQTGSTGGVYYYLRSSVFGGDLLETDSSGSMSKEYVYSPDKSMVAYLKDSDVVWNYEEPSGKEIYSLKQDRSAFTKITYDPTGTQATSQGYTDGHPCPPQTCSSPQNSTIPGPYNQGFDATERLNQMTNQFRERRNQFDSLALAFQLGVSVDPTPAESARKKPTLKQRFASSAEPAGNPSLSFHVVLGDHHLPPMGEAFGVQWAFVFGSEIGGSRGNQLPLCLRDFLRQFFPTVQVGGQTISPVDDARFITDGYVPNGMNAMTEGLYNINYNPPHYDSNGNQKGIDLTGGQDKTSIGKIAEEIAHTYQFTEFWQASTDAYNSSDSRGKYEIGDPYQRARLNWGAAYLAESLRIKAVNAAYIAYGLTTGIQPRLEDPYNDNKYEKTAKAKAALVQAAADALPKSPCYP